MGSCIGRVLIAVWMQRLILHTNCNPVGYLDLQHGSNVTNMTEEEGRGEGGPARVWGSDNFHRAAAVVGKHYDSEG